MDFFFFFLLLFPLRTWKQLGMPSCWHSHTGRTLLSTVPPVVRETKSAVARPWVPSSCVDRQPAALCDRLVGSLRLIAELDITTSHPSLRLGNLLETARHEISCKCLRAPRRATERSSEESMECSGRVEPKRRWRPFGQTQETDRAQIRVQPLRVSPP